MGSRRARSASSMLDDNGDVNPPQTRGSRTVVARRALVAVGLALVGLSGLAAANLFMTLDVDQVGAWVTPRASAALNRPVSLGEAGISLWPRPSLRVTDVSVDNLPGFQGPRLAHVEVARLDVAWLPLIVGRVHVRRLVLEGASLHLAIDQNGLSNFGDLVPRSVESSQGTSAPVAMRLQQIALAGGSLTYSDAHGGRSLLVSGIDAEAVLSEGEVDGWRSTIAARSDSLLVRFAGLGEEIVRGAGPSAVLLAHGGTPPGTIEIDEGHLQFADDTLAVYGALSLGGTEPTVDLLFTEESVPAGFLTAFFPREKRPDLLPLVEGTLDVTVRLLAGGNEVPSLRGSARMRDVGVRIRGEPMIDKVGGIVAISPDTIAFDAVSGRFAGGPFELSGTIERSAGMAAFVARGEPDLDAFDRLGLLPEGTTLSGNADLYLSIAGPTRALDSMEVVGVAELRGLQLEDDRLGVPLYVPSGAVSLVGREAHWADLTFLVGDDRAVTSGSIQDLFAFWPGAPRAPWVDASLSAPHLDLNEALPRRDTSSEATYAQLAMAHLGGRPVDGRSAAAVAAARGMARPMRLPAHGIVDLTVDTLLFRAYDLQSVHARVELGDSLVAVNDASFEAWSGQGNGSLRMGIGSERDEPFALDLSVQEVEAEPFLASMTPAGEAVSGTLDLRLGLEGSTDASLLPYGEGLTGEVAMSIVGGTVGGTGVNMALADFLDDDAWEEVAFSDWVVEMGIQDRVLHVRRSTIDGAPGAVALSGSLRLDGSADLSVGVSIPPERLGSVSLRRTGIAQSVLDQLRRAGGTLDLGLRLSGWLQAPTLEPDATSAVASAR